jgi:hypothetical protein
MLQDASGRKEFRALAELAMQELTEQFNLVSSKNFEDFERNLQEEDIDDFMDVVKKNQLGFIKWKLAVMSQKTKDKMKLFIQ